MQVLVINQNATIERLVSLSSGKMGYTMRQYPELDSAEAGEYDFFVMDSDLYKDGDLDTIKTIAPSASFILIVSKNIDKPDGFDVYLEKPFLPTELVDVYTKEQARRLNPIQDSDGVLGNDLAFDSTDDSFSELSDELPSFDFADPSAIEPITIPEDDSHDFLNEYQLDDAPADASIQQEDSSDDFTFDLDSVLDHNETTVNEIDDSSLEHHNNDITDGLDEFKFDEDVSDAIELPSADEEEFKFDEDVSDAIELPSAITDDDEEFKFDDIEMPSVDEPLELPSLEDDEEFKFDDIEMPSVDEPLELPSLEDEEEFKFDEDVSDAIELPSAITDGDEEFKFDDIEMPSVDEPLELPLIEDEEEFTINDILEDQDSNIESVLDEEDVSEIKNLLDDDKSENFVSEIDELDTLDEDLLADALGVELSGEKSQTDDVVLSDDKIATSETNSATNLSETANINAAIDIDNLVSVLKEALLQDNVTINLTITKNSK